MATAASSVATERAPAATTLDPDVDRHIGAVRESEAERPSGRSLYAGLFFATAFLATASALALWLSSSRSPGLVTVVGLILAYAAASHARFEVGTGLSLPTALVFVPMLFLLPLGYVPLAICAGLLVGAATDLLRRGLPLEKVLLVPLNSWYSIGPVIVLAAAGEARPGLEHWPVYIAALGAQFAADYFIQAPYQRFVNDVPFPLAARFMSSAFVVDVALAPIGLLVAFVAVDHPVALTFVLPLIGLLVIFARERQVRIDHALELSHAYRGTALLLGDVVEADDAYTGSHSRDVVTLVLDVSDRLQLNARDRRDAEFAALLHDIGKIRVPAEIINKPGKLDDHEWARDEAAHDRRRAPALTGRRSARQHRTHRAVVPRRLGRDRLSRRNCGKRHSSGRTDRARVRRIQRDDDGPRLQEGAERSGGSRRVAPLRRHRLRSCGRRGTGGSRRSRQLSFRNSPRRDGELLRGLGVQVLLEPLGGEAVRLQLVRSLGEAVAFVVEHDVLDLSTQ